MSVSFQFTKRKINSFLISSSSSKENEKEEKVNYIHEIVKGKEKRKRKEKKELIIPCHPSTYYSSSSFLSKNDSETKDAILEILEDTKKDLESWNTRDSEIRSDAISLPTKESGIESGLDDYETIPISSFGSAMLRGMGWSPGTEIGTSKSKLVEVFETPVARTKGLGLGAVRKAQNDDESLSLGKGAFVFLLKGSHRDTYGTVEALDENSGRFYVKLALGGAIEYLSEDSLKVVSKKEFSENSKVINKKLYETIESQNKRKKEKEEKKKKLFKNNVSKKVESVFYQKDSCKEFSWVRPHLRVRLIDKKNSNYYNTKMMIEDVRSSSSCLCISDKDQRILEVKARDLETVLPRNAESLVMVLRGSHKGALARILQRDKNKYKALIQLTNHLEEIFEIDFDEICEYTGEEDF